MKRDEITANDLKTRCSEVLELVARGRRTLTVTRYGRAVARIVPVEKRSTRLFGFAAGCVVVHGDLLAPIDVEWEAAG